jgi:hypothetical protein
MLDKRDVRRIAAEFIGSAASALQEKEPESGPFAKAVYRDARITVWRRNRAMAACWLASKEAAKWFSLLDYDQADKLRYIGWPQVAEEILKDKKSCQLIGRARERLLRQGLAHFNGME